MLIIKGVLSLNLADDTYLACLKELNDSVYFLAFWHLLLYLVDSVEHTGLTVEHKTIGIGNVADNLIGYVRRLEQRLVYATIAHRIVSSYDEWRHILRDAHTTCNH